MDSFFRFNAFILSHTNFTNEELKTFDDMCELQSFKKGEIMVQKNEVCSKLYFLTKGIVKYWLINQNKE
jgi:signal-transduction protein with cAMP-binding, CBS, and nucleotidyltransferase domain